MSAMSRTNFETPRNGTTLLPSDGLLSDFTMHSLDGTDVDETAVICHELQNSLAVVRGAARLLKSPAATIQINTARSLIERHVEQMSRHIGDLLDPLRRTGRRLKLRLSHVDLREIASNAIDAIGPEMTLRRHRLAVNLPETPIWAHVDGERFEQALANLLINAAKYTPDGGDVALTMDRVGDRVYVRVRDTGVGIEPAMLSRVFGMFMQVERAQHSSENGSGIGLAVVKKLVELHGGVVSAASAGAGSGSEFTIMLPMS
jgi:signal transduction histidine kinase